MIGTKDRATITHGVALITAVNELDSLGAEAVAALAAQYLEEDDPVMLVATLAGVAAYMLRTVGTITGTSLATTDLLARLGEQLALRSALNPD